MRVYMCVYVCLFVCVCVVCACVCMCVCVCVCVFEHVHGEQLPLVRPCKAQMIQIVHTISA